MAASKPMRKVSLRNLAAHKVRLALTVLSVVLGTAFVTGSFVFTDTLSHTFHGLFAAVAKGVDVQVTGKQENGSGVPLRDLATIRGVPGVRTVETSASGQIVVLGSDGKPLRGGGAPSLGMSYAPPAEHLGNPFVFIAGSPPSGPNQIALNKGALKLGKLAVGGRTKVLVPSRGTLDVTITGEYNTKSDTGGYVGALFVRSQALSLFTDGTHVEAVDVAGNGISQQELKNRIASVLPDVTVKTGAEVTKQTEAGVNTALKFINYFLLAFGAIALLVGTFIIYNTFSMIVAQRLRELALLRAIGASRRQVSRSVLVEAIAVGLVGSIIGIAGGVGLAYGLRALLNAFNVGLPNGPLQLTVRTILVALAVGIVVTVFSAYAPARRAAKIPPVAAMREEFSPSASSLRVRTLLGAIAAAVGILALVAGGLAKAGGSAAGLVGIGALALIIGVLLGAPALSRPIVGAVGAPFGRIFGPVGRLARTNATRNRRRTAATAFALTLGLMLVTAIAVFGASAKKSINALVDDTARADYILTGPNAIGVPAGVRDAVANLAGVGTATALEPVIVKIDGKTSNGTGVNGSLTDVAAVDVQQGRLDLTGDNIAVSADTAQQNGWQVGSTVAMVSLDGKQIDTKVTAVYQHNQLLGKWLASDELYNDVTPTAHRSDMVVLVRATPGTNLGTLRGELERATDPFLVITVENRDQFKGSQARQIDSLLAILYGLLALAIVIAVLGIINTLALSVVERRREIGMLRAVGMLRAQVRRTIYLESALIATFGAIVGVLLGATFGALFVHTLRDQGLDHIAVPYGQAVAMLLLSAVVGVLAALWPAVRAARTRPLEAITDL